MIPYRSLLFVPAVNERALEKSKTLMCDGVILDLEDSVSDDRKDEARATVIKELKAAKFAAPHQMARVNAVGGVFFESDLKALAEIGPKAILVPKVESAADVLAAVDILDDYSSAKNTRIWIMIESAKGVLNVQDICAASSRLEGMIIGPNDLLKDLNAKATPGQEALLTSFGICMIAARAHGMICIDGIYNQFKDVDGFYKNCQLGHVLGYEGKTLIHPAQIDVANDIFGPSDVEIDLAKRKIEAFEGAVKEGKAVAVVDGELVEKMHIETAKDVLKIATYIEQRKT